MKKTLFTLIIILALNWISSTLILDLNLDSSSTEFFTIRAIQKACLITICVFLIIQLKSSVDLFSNSAWAIPLAALLLVLAYNYVDGKTIMAKASVPVSTNLAFLISCLAVGFFEELLFRVYVFSMLKEFFDPKDKWSYSHIVKTMLWTSAIFGLAHLSNIFRQGYSIDAVISQVLLAFAIGVLLQALLIRFNNLFLIGMLHGIFNYLGSYRSSLIGSSLESEAFVVQEFLISLAVLVALFVLFIAPISHVLIRSKTS